MDLTLSQINERVTDLYLQIENNNNFIDFNKNKILIAELKKLEDKMTYMYEKVSNIRHLCSNKYLKFSNVYMVKKNKYDKQKTDNFSDHIDDVYSEHKTFKDIAHNIPINTKIIDDVSEIPNLPLYWVSNINQFALRINGVIFRGNIGNIYNKSHSYDNVNQILICKNGNICQNLYNNKLCKFYHDPYDLLQLLNEEKISQEIFDKYKISHRNFINTSWIYTELHHNKKNLFMRHFGSKNTLNNEIDLMQINSNKTTLLNINNYQHQTMHDILVVLSLNQRGLIE
jgi:hypothetical protein